ncbi:phage major capsid protein [Rhodocyclus tenuis]|uniref:Bacteriophage Mu GpT domain-containing protein n=1 Tax=Rhodocyclus tenuis TaxID=1066 RepID=A0A840G7R4_RHOTE|nr:hypothetical protein [Rhodocyclus tenuis]MBB4248383.1 hypothetical protein [Rhodocyclus tenuis]
MRVIPANGIRGQVALREAAEVVSEWRQIMELVRDAIRRTFASQVPSGEAPWVGLEAMYPDRAVIEIDGKYWAYPYTLDGNTVTLGVPVQVLETYVPIKEAEPGFAAGAFIEAISGDNAAASGKWLIRVIRAGLSANDVFYPDAVLREAVPLFNGARVFMKSDAEHIKGAGKDVRNLIGGLAQAEFVEGAGADQGEIRAVFTLIEAEGAEAVKLREAYDRGLAGLFGFSIDASGAAKADMREGKKVRVARSITQVQSVDLIVEPGAGGELIRLVEAAPATPHEENEMGLRQKMIEAIAAKRPGYTGEGVSDEQLETDYREAVAGTQFRSGQEVSGKDALAAVRLVEARFEARVMIGGSTLPQVAKDKLLSRFAEAKDVFAVVDVQKAIDDERAYLAKFTESGRVVIPGLDIEVEDRSVKMASMLDAFFDPTHKDHEQTQSFRECYGQLTGDFRVTGRIEDCDRTRMAESFGAVFRESVDTAGFANVLGNSLRRAMLSNYRAAVDFQAWKQIVNIVPINDFRSNERVRYGGYGDLPAVAEKGAYTALTTPTDEKASYAVTKRGGTEAVSLEAIRNDDVGAIRQVPIRMGRSAARTLAKFVFDFLRTNPTIYDTLTLFHATHGNLFTAALDATTFNAHRLAMMKQTEIGSLDRLGIAPSFLVVPVELQDAAVNLFNRSTNLDKTFIQSLAPTIIPVWYWTDANDWCTAANPLDIPGIEIGFLDGKQEPDMFVQDMPTVGSLFSNDQVTYKLRHVYGGNVTDFRGFTKAVVP